MMIKTISFYATFLLDSIL